MLKKSYIAYADNDTHKDKNIDELYKIAKKNLKIIPKSLSDEMIFNKVKIKNIINSEKTHIIEIKEFIEQLYSYILNRKFVLNDIKIMFRVVQIERNINSDFCTEEEFFIKRGEVYIYLTKEVDSKIVSVHEFLDGSVKKVLNDFETIFKRIDELYIHLQEKMHATYIKEGVYTCYINPSFTGILTHEAVGHLAEADTYNNSKKYINNYEKEEYYNGINIIDYANSQDGIIFPSPVYIDNQTVKAENVYIMKEGIFVKRCTH